MKGFSVDLPLLHRAAKVWDDQADNVKAAQKRLKAASSQSSSLGDRVGPVAQEYFATWQKEAGARAGAAQTRANDLAKIGHDYVVLDEEAAQDLQASLPWGKGSAIREAEVHPVEGLRTPKTLPDLLSPGQQP